MKDQPDFAENTQESGGNKPLSSFLSERTMFIQGLYERFKSVANTQRFFLDQNKGKQYPNPKEFDKEFDEWFSVPENIALWEKEVANLKREIAEKLGASPSIGEMLNQAEQKDFRIDPESLLEEFNAYCAYRGVEAKPDTRTLYLPILAISKTLFEGNLEGKVIVEIGPGREGFFILQYLSQRGADTVGIDVDDPGEGIRGKTPNVKFISGSWEEISGLLPPGSVDMIYTHYMHPHPEQGGKYEHNRKAFEIAAQGEMDKVLKPNGFYVGHSVETDFILPSEEFEKKGYQTIRLSLPEINRNDPRLSDEIKRKFIRNSERGYEFGRRLSIHQKQPTEEVK